MSMRSFQRRPNLRQGRDMDSLATLCVGLIPTPNTKNWKSAWKVRRNVEAWKSMMMKSVLSESFRITCASTSVQVHCRAAWVKAKEHLVKRHAPPGPRGFGCSWHGSYWFFFLDLSCSFPVVAAAFFKESLTRFYNYIRTCPTPQRTMKDLSDSFVKCYEARTCHDLLGVILGESCASRNKDIAWNGMSHVGMSNIHELFQIYWCSLSIFEAKMALCKQNGFCKGLSQQNQNASAGLSEERAVTTCSHPLCAIEVCDLEVPWPQRLT